MTKSSAGPVLALRIEFLKERRPVPHTLSSSYYAVMYKNLPPRRQPIVRYQSARIRHGGGGPRKGVDRSPIYLLSMREVRNDWQTGSSKYLPSRLTRLSSCLPLAVDEMQHGSRLICVFSFIVRTCDVLPSRSLSNVRDSTACPRHEQSESPVV